MIIPEGAREVGLRVGDDEEVIIGWVMPERGTIPALLHSVASEVEAIEEEWDAATPEASDSSDE